MRRVVWGMGGVSFPQPIRGLGSVVRSLNEVQGGTPQENACWSILKAMERSYLHLHVYANALNSSNSQQCFRSHWGAKLRCGGNYPRPNGDFLQ